MSDNESEDDPRKVPKSETERRQETDQIMGEVLSWAGEADGEEMK